MVRVRLPAWVLLVAAACAPPPPSSIEDLPPCTALRRQVCGPSDECANPGPTADACALCKQRLCTYVRVLEDDFDGTGNQAACLAEMRARPEYPVCRLPDPLPTIPPPPILVRVQCETECNPLPTIPEPAPPS